MENRDWPLVTVFTLVYNTGKYVIEALESVQANEYPNLQHIIIDDCSTDGESVKMVEDWIAQKKYSCEFIKHDINYGICKSLNEAFALAKGKYILGVSDDLIDVNRIKEHVLFFESRPVSTAVIYSDIRVIDAEGALIDASYLEKRNAVQKHESTYYNLLEDCYIPAPGVTMRLESVKAVGYFDESIYMEDWDLWLRISQRYEIERLSGIHGSYRKRTNSLTGIGSTLLNEAYLRSVLKNVTDPKSVEIALPNLMKFAENNYRDSGNRIAYYFLRIFLLSGNLKALVMASMAGLGISYKTFLRLLQIKTHLNPGTLFLPRRR